MKRNRRLVIYALLGAFCVFVTTLPSAAMSGGVGLAYDRLFDVPAESASETHAYFLARRASGSLVTNAIFSLTTTLPSTGGSKAAATPTFFVSAAGSRDAESQAIGSAGIRLNFKLLGGNQSIGYQSADAARFPNLTPIDAAGVALDQQLDLADTALAFPAALPATRLLPFSGALQPVGPYGYRAYPPAIQGPAVQLNFPLTLGKIAGSANAAGQWLQLTNSNTPALEIFGEAGAPSSAAIARLSGGMGLNVPLFKSTATVSLEGLWERLAHSDKRPAGAAPDSLGLITLNPAGLPESPRGRLLEFASTYANVRRTIGSASASVPISPALTANVSYITQRIRGETIGPSAQSINAKNTAFTGGFLYNIPNTNTSLNYFFTRSRFRDDTLPASGWVQNRQNLYFTVKF